MRWQRWDRLQKEREQAWNRPQNASCLQKPKPAAKPPVRLKLTSAKILVIATMASFYLPVCLWHTVLKRCDIFLIWFSLLLSPPWLTRLSLLSSAPLSQRSSPIYRQPLRRWGLWEMEFGYTHMRSMLTSVCRTTDRGFGNVLGFLGGYE